MAIVTQYKCDGCGTEKKEANHWWVIAVEGGVLHLISLDRAGTRKWDGFEILCGQECVSKKVSEFMGAKR
jgi:hypothetical protein